MYILCSLIILGSRKMSKPEFEPVHVYVSENGKNQSRHGHLRAEYSERDAARQSAFFHRTRQDIVINFFLGDLKVISDFSRDKIE